MYVCVRKRERKDTNAITATHMIPRFSIDRSMNGVWLHQGIFARIILKGESMIQPISDKGMIISWMSIHDDNDDKL